MKPRVLGSFWHYKQLAGICNPESLSPAVALSYVGNSLLSGPGPRVQFPLEKEKDLAQGYATYFKYPRQKRVKECTLHKGVYSPCKKMRYLY